MNDLAKSYSIPQWTQLGVHPNNYHWCGSRLVMFWGGRLNIKMLSCHNRDPHVKDIEIPIPGKTIYMLRQGPGVLTYQSILPISLRVTSLALSIREHHQRIGVNTSHGPMENLWYNHNKKCVHISCKYCKKLLCAKYQSYLNTNNKFNDLDVFVFGPPFQIMNWTCHQIHYLKWGLSALVCLA